MKAWEPMNREAVEKLFTNEAVLFGDSDGIPYNRAVQIFGTGAIEFAKSMEDIKKGRIIINCYGIEDYQALYLTRIGAQVAATYNNVLSIKVQETD